MPKANLAAPQTYAALRRAVEAVVFKGRQNIERAWVRTYHDTGRLINEHILDHSGRAAYGAQIFDRLAQDTGISKRTLHECAQFHRCFPIVRSTAELTRTHYIVLCQIKDERQRTALLKESISQSWTVAELEERVRALNATVATPAEALAKPATAPRLLTPKRGTPGICRIVADGDGVAVDLGFACFLTTDPATKLRANDLVRVTSDGLQVMPDATKADLFTYRAEVIRVVDGDTLWVKVFLRPDQWVKQKLRLRDLDCPEIATPEGKAAKRFVEAMLVKTVSVTICTTKPDKYDRYLADVFFVVGDDTVYLNNTLLTEGHAVRKNEYAPADWEA